MLCAGTEQKPYEQFGVMPSLSYPSKIECVGGGKAELELGTIASATGTNNASNQRVRTKDYIRVISNTECTIDADNVDEVVVFQYDENETKILATSWLELPYSFILDKNTRYIRYAFRCSDDSVLTADEVKDKSKWLSSIEINTSNKNICQSQVSSWELGMYSTDGQKVSHTSRVRCKDLTLVPSRAEIYFNTFNDEYSFVVRTYDKNKEFLSSAGEKINGTKLVLDSNVKYISNTIMRKNASGSSGEGQAILDKIASGEIKPFICLSSEADKTFVEHRGETHIMPIQQAMYENDTFERINGIWYEKHNKVKMVFDGTENWNFNYNSAIFMLDANNILTLSSAETSKLSNFIQSNTYSNKVYDAMYNKQTDGIEALNNRINIRESSCSTVAEFKTLLAQRYAENKAIYAICRLKEPLLLKCTSEQSAILDKIDTYRDGTIINTDNDLCKISLRYKQSLEAAIKEYTATNVAESE